MADYRLTAAARDDLAGIFDYTLDRFGERQAEVYVTALRHSFDLLARNPGMGRPRGRIRRGLRCHEHGGHLVFYFPAEDHILIVRVLHRRVDPAGYPD